MICKKNHFYKSCKKRTFSAWSIMLVVFEWPAHPQKDTIHAYRWCRGGWLGCRLAGRQGSIFNSGPPFWRLLESAQFVLLLPLSLGPYWSLLKMKKVEKNHCQDQNTKSSSSSTPLSDSWAMHKDGRYLLSAWSCPCWS